VFTCHDHILSLFRSLKVDVRRLPSHREAAEGGPSRGEKRRHAKRKRRARRPEPVEVFSEDETPSFEEDEPADEADDRPVDEPDDDELDEEEDWEEEDEEQDEDGKIDDAA
jgi:hypothetical protein